MTIIEKHQSTKVSASEDDQFIRDLTINEIINLVQVLKIKEVEAWEDISFTKIDTLRSRSDLSIYELIVLRDILNNMYEEGQFATTIPDFVQNQKEDGGLEDEGEDFEIPKRVYGPFKEAWRYDTPQYVRENVEGWESLAPFELEIEVDDLLQMISVKGALRDTIEDFRGILEDLLLEEEDEGLDILKVIEKYKDGRTNSVETVNNKEVDQSWRKLIPLKLKAKMDNWQTADIHKVYEQAKDLLPTDRDTFMPFVSEMSQLIFVDLPEKDEQDSVEVDFTDSISDSIMSLVEMIILPHIEVLDHIQKNGGNVTFKNIWNETFNEELKIRVKDRDGWRCVICEGETSLHVHHKIPREKGGPHHPDNLVTLCASCHSAVETADVKSAFHKCLANYKKNKFRQMRPKGLSIDKNLLKDEVEKSLDHILLQLNQKDEHELMEEVIGVMDRLDVLFYN